MDKFSVSVVIPVYNGATTVSETLHSVFAQSLPAHEIIVVNDGSKDNTLEVLHSFGERIRVLDIPNGGVSGARNAGVLAATGDWVAFLDGDDIWHPDKLALHAQSLEEYPHSVVLYSEFQSWFPTSTGEYPAPQQVFPQQPTAATLASHSGWMYAKQLLTNWVLTSSSVVKREHLLVSGLFDAELPVAEDWDLFIRLSRKGHFCKLAAPLVLYRQSAGSLSTRIFDKDYASCVVNAAVAKYGFENPDGSASISAKEFDARQYERHMHYAWAARSNQRKDLAIKTLRHAFTLKPNLKDVLTLLGLKLGLLN